MRIRNKKTGEILEDVKNIDTSLTTIEIYYLDNGVLRIKTEKDYHSFLQNWEDYDAPKEPLIKDEKVRKAVRAWAQACGLRYVTYEQASNGLYDPDTRGAFAIKFKLMPVEVYLEDGECYTIAELCGEGEE